MPEALPTPDYNIKQIDSAKKKIEKTSHELPCADTIQITNDGVFMLQKQLIEEIKQVPNEKLVEIYGLIHYFRLGLVQEKPSPRPRQRVCENPGALPAEILDAFEGR